MSTNITTNVTSDEYIKLQNCNKIIELWLWTHGNNISPSGTMSELSYNTGLIDSYVKCLDKIGNPNPKL
jgi:hypothetical protein